MSAVPFTSESTNIFDTVNMTTCIVAYNLVDLLGNEVSIVAGKPELQNEDWNVDVELACLAPEFATDFTV